MEMRSFRRVFFYHFANDFAHEATRFTRYQRYRQHKGDTIEMKSKYIYELCC